MKTKLIKTASGMEVRIWEGEEPSKSEYSIFDECYYSADLKDWHESYKSYPVRSEDEMEFTKLALRQVSWTKNDLTFFEALSQGIEIPNERVKIEGDICRIMECTNHCISPSNCQERLYATLLTEDKEGEGQGDAVEFAEWIQKEVEKENIMRSVIVGKYLIFENDDVIIRKTTQELYEQFKITRL